MALMFSAGLPLEGVKKKTFSHYKMSPRSTWIKRAWARRPPRQEKLSAQNWFQWQIASRLTNIRPWATWIVSVKRFNKYNIMSTEHIGHIYCQRKCWEIVITFKIAHRKTNIYLCFTEFSKAHYPVIQPYLQRISDGLLTMAFNRILFPPPPFAFDKCIHTCGLQASTWRNTCTWPYCGFKLASPGLGYELRLVCRWVRINPHVLAHWYTHYTA
jgi:hypothetical protein